uniref:Uncharacterized protein n=1 Tax=Rhizophora mucronata TaxID=61149 RepID=A0A2P2Q6W4_RHIMU
MISPAMCLQIVKYSMKCSIIVFKPNEAINGN